MPRTPAVEARRRTSRKREALKRILGEVEDFHSARELHALLHDRGVRLGLSTVYRALQRMAETGEVSVVYGRRHEAQYRLCGEQRHCHLVCRRCHRTVEVPDVTFAAWTEHLAKRFDFADIEPTQEVVGVCAECANWSSW